MKTILVLIDFSDVTRQVLDQALAMAKAFGGGMVLLHVVPDEAVLAVDFAPLPTSPDPEVFNARQRQLLALCESLSVQGVNVNAHQVQGELMTTLLRQIQEIHPDIIVMGSHGHGALYNLLVGSVTAAVLKHASQPVLVVPSLPAAPVHAEVMQAREHQPMATPSAGSLVGLPVPP